MHASAPPSDPANVDTAPGPLGIQVPVDDAVLISVLTLVWAFIRALNKSRKKYPAAAGRR